MSQKPDKDEEIKRLKKTIAGLVDLLLKTTRSQRKIKHNYNIQKPGGI